MVSLRRIVTLFFRGVVLLLVGFFRFLARLFFVDLWRNSNTRPVLLYAVFIVLLGTFLFHWLEKWSYLDSLYFVVITLTTIGYGDFAPTTTFSKILTIYYGINGIVLLLVLFDLIRHVRGAELVENKKKLAQLNAPLAHKAAEQVEMAMGADEGIAADVPHGIPKPHKPKSAKEMLKNTMRMLFLLDLFKDPQSQGILLYAAAIIALGAYAFHQIQDWSWLNSVYFMFITMTTIGYGDFSPTVPWGKVLTIFFGLNGIVVLLSLYDRIRMVRIYQHQEED
jgi:voltage-gated potassium channel Kch